MPPSVGGGGAILLFQPVNKHRSLLAFFNGAALTTPTRTLELPVPVNVIVDVDVIKTFRRSSR